MSNSIQNTVPEPPRNTALNSSLNGENPRTLWMGDLDPLFNEATLKQIWEKKNFKVKIKLIKNKKNLLIPCSNKFQNDNFGENGNGAASFPNSTSKKDVIEINGMKFVDPTTTSLHHSGYCFVEFESFELAAEGLRMNTTPIPDFEFTPDEEDLIKLEVINQNIKKANLLPTVFHTNKGNDRCFRLNWASSTTLNSPSVQTPEYSMFVGDLLPETAEIQLMVFFQKKYKSVKTVRIMTDPVSGKSRCFGFVRFGDKNEREDCVKTMNGEELNGKPIKCALAAPRAGSNQNMIDTTDFRGKSRGHNRSKSHEFKRTDLSAPYGHRKTRSTPSNDLYNPPLVEKFCLFVGGLNRNLEEGELFTCFQKIGKVLKIKTYAEKGCAFIDFSTKKDALQAILELDGFVLSSTNAPIRVTWSRDSNQSNLGWEENISPPVEFRPKGSVDESLVGKNTTYNQSPTKTSSQGYQSQYSHPDSNFVATSNYSENYKTQYYQSMMTPQNKSPYDSSLTSKWSPPFNSQSSQPQNVNQPFNNSISTGDSISSQAYYNYISTPNLQPNFNRRSSLLNSTQGHEHTSPSTLSTDPSLQSYLNSNSNSYGFKNNDKSIWDN